jgi:GNAT superfamily N-acetyltransferase
MDIRLAVPADSGAVWRILEPVIRAGETLALPRDMSEADALAYWMAPAHAVFVAEEGGRVLGTYLLKRNQPGGGGHVANCGYVVAQDAGGRGVARAMCAHSLDAARARGFRAMQFNIVVSTNRRAVAAWTSVGFAVVGRLPEAFLHPDLGYVDALVMYRAI